MVDFREIINTLVDIGFYDVFLPFILVYAVVFALLEKSKIFSGSDTDSKQVKNVNAIIAFVFGVLAVASVQTIKFLESFIMYGVMFIIFILVVLIVLGFIFGEDYIKLLKDGDGNLKKGLAFSIAGIVVLISIGVLFAVLGVWEIIFDFFGNDFDSDWISTALVIGLVIGTLVWVTKGDSSTSSSE